MPKLSDIVDKKFLGGGMFGSVFLVKHQGHPYALKIMHVDKNELREDTSSKLQRELFFQKFVAKNPDFFIKLHDYEFTTPCEFEHKHGIPLKNWPKENRKFFEALMRSPYCCSKLYDFVGTMLDHAIDHVTHKERLEIMIQFIVAVMQMKRGGFIHTDLHYGNLGLERNTDKAIVHSLDKFYKGFRPKWRLKVLDYDNVLHPKYKLQKWEKDQLKYDDDMANFANFFSGNTIWNYIQKHGVKLEWREIYGRFEKCPELEVFRKMIDSYNMPLWIKSNMLSKICAFTDVTLYVQLFLGISKKKAEAIKTIKVPKYFPLTELLRFFENFNKPGAVLERFIELYEAER